MATIININCAVIIQTSSRALRLAYRELLLSAGSVTPAYEVQLHADDKKAPTFSSRSPSEWTNQSYYTLYLSIPRHPYITTYLVVVSLQLLIFLMK